MAAEARKPHLLQNPQVCLLSKQVEPRAETVILISARPSMVPSIQNTTGRDEVSEQY